LKQPADSHADAGKKDETSVSPMPREQDGSMQSYGDQREQQASQKCTKKDDLTASQLDEIRNDAIGTE
jgi:hypothetical protein